MRWLLLAVMGCGGSVVVDAPPPPAAEVEPGAGGADAGIGGAGGGAAPSCVWSLEATCCTVVGPNGEFPDPFCEPIRVPDCIISAERCGNECAVRDVCWNGSGDCRTEPIPNDTGYWVVCEML